MKYVRCSSTGTLLLLICFAAVASPRPAGVDSFLAACRQVGLEGSGNDAAAKAWRDFVPKARATTLPDLLAALDATTPLQSNWIRSAIDAIAERSLKDGEKLPLEEIERFLRDRRHEPRARRLAFELVVRGDPGARDRIVPTLLVVFGFGVSVARTLRTRGRAAECPLVVLVALALPSFVAFTWMVPSLSATKASYLLPLLMPAGVFFANGCALLPAGGQRIALACSAGAAALAAFVFTTGTVFAPTNAQASQGFWMAMGRQLPDPYLVEAALRLIE